MTQTPFTGWAIDRDYINNGEYADCNRVGYGQILNEADATAADYDAFMRRIEIVTQLRTSDVTDPVRFRLLDDDGEVYYGGAISREIYDDEIEMTGTLPLSWGEADAGAVTIQHRADDLPEAVVTRHVEIGCATPDGKWITIFG